MRRAPRPGPGTAAAAPAAPAPAPAGSTTPAPSRPRPDPAGYGHQTYQSWPASSDHLERGLSRLSQQRGDPGTLQLLGHEPPAGAAFHRERHVIPAGEPLQPGPQP